MTGEVVKKRRDLLQKIRDKYNESPMDAYNYIEENLSNLISFGVLDLDNHVIRDAFSCKKDREIIKKALNGYSTYVKCKSAKAALEKYFACVKKNKRDCRSFISFCCEEGYNPLYLEDLKKEGPDCEQLKDYANYQYLYLLRELRRLIDNGSFNTGISTIDVFAEELGLPYCDPRIEAMFGSIDACVNGGYLTSTDSILLKNAEKNYNSSCDLRREIDANTVFKTRHV